MWEELKLGEDGKAISKLPQSPAVQGFSAQWNKDEDGPEADKEVAYTDRGMDSGAGGTFVEPKEWRFGNAWSLREDSGDIAERERN